MELTKSQQEAFDAYTRGESFFLAGKAGTGKSFLLRRIIDDAKANGKSVIACAPTGVAAINIDGATIHRTFQAPVELIDEKRNYCCMNRNKLNVLREADIIIIDEISMCRIDLFEFVMRTIGVTSRRKKKQVILSGDFFQLPPVLTDREEEAFYTLYESTFAFTSKLWDFDTIELTEVVRQEEESYVNALNNIRIGKPDLSVFRMNGKTDWSAVTVCTTNYSAAQINNRMLQATSEKNKSPKRDYVSQTVGSLNQGDKMTDDVISLCVGARVILLVNNPDEGYVNGSLGTVTAMKDDGIFVLLDVSEDEVYIKNNTWEIARYILRKGTDYDGNEVNHIERETLGTFTQLPVKLAWAVTVHKSQGQTFDKVNINANDNYFAEGQLYVALSRCKTLEGLNVVGTLTPTKVKCSQAVTDFYENNRVRVANSV